MALSKRFIDGKDEGTVSSLTPIRANKLLVPGITAAAWNLFDGERDLVGAGARQWLNPESEELGFVPDSAIALAPWSPWG